MLPIHELIWHEWRARRVTPLRVPEPSEAMEDPEQIRAYVKAYEWGGPTSALQLHHLQQLSTLIRPGDTVLDLACGPGPLLLELAPLYPSCRFIGADLSQQMLDVLISTAKERGIENVRALREDIRRLPSVPAESIDLVITTSALHHLPDLECLEQVLDRVRRVLKPDGGLYIFDFGLVRSQRARELLVADIARRAPQVTATDYKHSLDAAFPIDSVAARVVAHVQRPLTIRVSRFIDFFYFVRTPGRTAPPSRVLEYVRARRADCPLPVRLEGVMLSLFQKTLRSSVPERALTSQPRGSP